MRNARFFALLLLAATSAGCGDAPTPPPQPGVLLATLVSPHGAEGAAVFELRGVESGSITALEGQLFVEHQGRTARVVLIADTPGPLRFRVGVVDLGAPPSAAVVEVSDPDGALRTAPAGYSVQLTDATS